MAQQNLIIDLNYILMKNVFTLIKTNTLYGDFHKALTNNILKYSDMFNCKVHIVSDSRQKSWRKEMLDSYKGTRVKDETIDWNWIFKEFEYFKDNIHETIECKVYQANRIEGDDWIMALVKKHNKMKESNIVISSDKDLQQLLAYKIDSWINIQIDDKSGSERIYVPEGYKLYLNSIEEDSNDDPFNLSASSGKWVEQLNKVIKSYSLEEINPYQLLFTKIVKGDSGDNIKSIYTKLTKTGKTQGIGDAGAEKIWKMYNVDYGDVFNTKEDILKERIIESIEVVQKVKLDDIVKTLISKRIDENISLIELHYRHYPEDILDEILEQIQ